MNAGRVALIALAAWWLLSRSERRPEQGRPAQRQPERPGWVTLDPIERGPIRGGGAERDWRRSGQGIYEGEIPRLIIEPAISAGDWGRMQ